jgi:tetratricopeptide (TPR) repeat protein
MYEDGEFDQALREILKVEARLQNDAEKSQVLFIKSDILLIRGEYQEAREILVKLNALNLNPTLRARVLLNQAIIARNLHNNTEAYNLVNSYIRNFPNTPRINDAYQLLGDLYIEQGKFAEADKIFTDLHKKSQSGQTFTNLIRLAIAQNNIAKAETYLNEMKSAFPKAHLEQQQGLLLILNAYENLANYNKILELCPATFEHKTVVTEDLIMKRVVALINLKNLDEAERLSAEIKNDAYSADYYRALILREKGDPTAVNVFRRITQSSAPQAIKTMSFFNMVQLIAVKNPTDAYTQLQDFLIANPDQEWEGDIMYHLAFIEFQNRNYEKAYDYVNRALNFNMNKVNQQNAVYLKGELEFLLKKFETSAKTFNQYLSEIPAGFIDDVIFKMGLNYYFLARPDSSSRYFTRLIMQHPSSDKIGAAYFYLGEIELHRNLNFARSNYPQALSGTFDKGVVNLRLAYIDYMRKEYPAALETLNKVSETEDYLFDKYLLKGNILFAQKNYDGALEAYRVAERNADQVSVQYVWSRQAWTHYNRGNYDAATAIYKRLAEQSATPAGYILSAAGAAFNADNFEQALSLFREFIVKYPHSP